MSADNPSVAEKNYIYKQTAAQAVFAQTAGSASSAARAPSNLTTLTGDVTGSGTETIPATLASMITAGGPTGGAATVPVITYDAKGRLTAVTTAAITPAAIGAPSGSGTSTGTNTGDQTNISGNAATVTTNANLTGPITSSGNVTSVASQTGTGSKFVMDTSPTLVTPNIGAATGSSLSLSSGALTAGAINANATITTNTAGAVLSTTPAVGNNAYWLLDQSVNNAGKSWRLGHTGGVAGYSTFDLLDLTDNKVVWSASATGLAVTGALSATTTIKSGGYTVGTLPANAAGLIAYVTDQLTVVNARGVAPTGGGAVVCYQMNTGAGWVGI